MLVALSHASADLMYIESGGIISGEAEIFTDRQALGDGRTWTIVPTEASGSSAIVNSRNGSYIAALPDLSTSGLGPLTAPQVTYKLQINTPGSYRLFTLWAKDTNINGGGNSDSWFSDIVELKDGTSPAFGTGSNLIPDWYEQATRNGGDFIANDWDGGGQAEVNQAADNNSPVVWDIPSAGIYTLRFTVREDGVAVDAFVFQRANLPAPTGNGPAMSQVIPEPSSLGLLLVGGLLLYRKTRRH
jgi:hypothetical protein